jgi:phage terminase Nu1 subunit (DNA packaging protein)
VPLTTVKQGVTTAEVAERLGVSQPRVFQLKAEGRFDGAWTKEKGVLSWDLELAQKCYSNGWNQRLKEEKSPTRKKTKDLEIPAFNDSRAKSEHFRSELARLDLETKEEQLVEASRVELEAFSAARAVRDALGNIPDRVSNQLAAETDPVVIHQLLTKEIRRALETLTDA